MPEEIKQARLWLRSELSHHLQPAQVVLPLIGVAGTATTLALLDQGLTTFAVDAIVNYRLSHRSVGRLLHQLCSISHEEILQLADALRGREDIIAAGALILYELMDILGAEELIVSERGIRYGLVHREWARLGGRDLGLQPM
jgi:exopolyphosphatase/guanosine-5'-triphosphate,3'-diphosphate pyrophosphatase